MKLLSLKIIRTLGMTVVSALLILHIIGIFTSSQMGINNLFILILLGILFAMMLYFPKRYMAQTEIIEVVSNMSKLITSVKDSTDLYQKILETVVNSIEGTKQGSICTFNGDDVYFDVVVGFNLDNVRQLKLKKQETFIFKETGGHVTESMVIKQIYDYNKAYVEEEVYEVMKDIHVNRVTSTISCPIFVNNEVFGLLNVDSDSGVVFKEKDRLKADLFAKEVSRIVSLYHLFEKTRVTANYDQMTGALNRHGFYEHMDQLFKDEPLIQDGFSICYYDLDRLKYINDHYGHDVGDRYIQNFVTGLKQFLMGEEIIARFGGDEFIILYIRSDEEQIQVFDEIKAYFQKEVLHIGEEIVPIKYSYGLSKYPEDGTAIKALVSKADQRMYRYKHAHRPVNNESVG